MTLTNAFVACSKREPRGEARDPHFGVGKDGPRGIQIVARTLDATAKVGQPQRANISISRLFACLAKRHVPVERCLWLIVIEGVGGLADKQVDSMDQAADSCRWPGVGDEGERHASARLAENIGRLHDRVSDLD
jgi:hypothetical protein